MHLCKNVLSISNMKIESEILGVADREQAHWQRVGLLVVFGGGAFFWASVILLADLIW